MFTSTTASKDSERTEERRSSRRETLKRHVVLVFFGEDNWGKLTNMSESGMAFVFAKPPSLKERVNFTFQAMGCMPMPRSGKALGETFEAPGEIVWTRDFERGAGVQFADLAEASREQIRQWLSFETSANTPSPAEKAKLVPPTLGDLLAPLARGSNPQSAPDKNESLIASGVQETLAERARDAESISLESPATDEPYEATAWSDQGAAAREPRVPQLPAYSHPSVARLTFFVVSGCLAAFAVTASVRILIAMAGHRADDVVRTSDSVSGRGGSAAEVNVSSPASPPVSSPAASVMPSSSISVPPFQVEVLDANGQGWILWFVRGGAKNNDGQPPYKLAGSSNSSAPTMTTTKRQEPASPEKPRAAYTFTMVAPNVSNPLSSSSAGKPPAEAPAIQPELTHSSGDPFGGALGRPMVPAAPAVHAPTGGMVQQPRLIRSIPPVYPQLAKSSRVSGDVVVDAQIDAAGKVTSVKVISGPVLLQQAAVETVRHWNYEPARLDGQAVPMHLTVTVRFSLK